MEQFVPSQQAEFQREILKSEILRTQIMLGIWVVAGSFSIVGPLIIGKHPFLTLFQNELTIYFIYGGTFMFFANQVFFLIYLKRRLRKGTTTSSIFTYLQAIEEISFPAAFLLILISLEKSIYWIESPIFLLSFVILMLSALHLDPKLSLILGVIGALEFIVLGLWAANQFPVVTDDPLHASNSIYLIRGGIIFACGLTAAAVAYEINRRLGYSLTAMHQRLEVERLLGQQVSPEVVEALFEESRTLNSQEVEATILFLDIRNFTPFAEARTPGEVIEFQNTIFSPLIECVYEYKGIINQIMGDGFMATFGAPIHREDHANQAVAAALKMLRCVEDLQNSGAIPPTRIGIGLHSGNIVTGNIGNTTRKQYSITGTTVILASRIEQLNKTYNSQLLISGEVRKQANGLCDNFEHLGLVKVKGSEQELELFRGG
ncbi:MAG: adenylate/guanylate cyclase domain-containing protein [Bacteroidota bacterium]